MTNHVLTKIPVPSTNKEVKVRPHVSIKNIVESNTITQMDASVKVAGQYSPSMPVQYSS